MKGLPTIRKIPRHERWRTYVSQLMIIPTLVGAVGAFMSFNDDSISLIYSALGVSVAVLSMVLMVLFTECKRLIIHPSVYVERDGCHKCYYVVVEYPSRGFMLNGYSSNLVWQKINRITPWIYIAEGEPFKGGETPFMRRKKYNPLG